MSASCPTARAISQDCGKAADPLSWGLVGTCGVRVGGQFADPSGKGARCEDRLIATLSRALETFTMEPD